MRTRSRTSAYRTAQLAERARGIRWAPTPSEARLWEALRGGKLGVVFRRQVVIAGYTPSGIAKRVIVDFAATKARLIVEVDGGWHAGRERADARRDRALERAGWRVVRVAAEGVRAKPEVAVERIKAALAAAKAGAP